VYRRLGLGQCHEEGLPRREVILGMGRWSGARCTIYVPEASRVGDRGAPAADQPTIAARREPVESSRHACTERLARDPTRRAG
jgi:hypothetical protein